eukprot:GFUD01026619.1.p1 GENE.GFUD01026619.1~~GFUD01026619.1.p1  ORF type:complete len:1642 (+),score=519.71 GFUD01026619.1:27-4952(+)
MKYRTRSSASKQARKVYYSEEVMEKEAVNVNTEEKISCDTKEKLFVRKDSDIDFTAVLRKEIVGENDIKFVMKDGDVVETSRSLMCLTSSTVDTLLSLMPCCYSSTILIPDYTAAALNMVLELLTSGSTVENNLDKKQVQEVKNLAKELAINVNGIATSNQYYEIVDSSENNSVVSDKKDATDDVTLKSTQNRSSKFDASVENEGLADEVSEGSDMKDSFLSDKLIEEDNGLDTLAENLPRDASLAEVDDEVVDDILEVEEASASSFENGIKLNSTSNVEKGKNLNESQILIKKVEMELEMDEDFEFDEEYPDEEDWDVEAELLKEEPYTKIEIDSKQGKNQSMSIQDENIKDTAKSEKRNCHTGRESSEEVHVKVNSLHGMIDSFLSSFKDGSIKGVSQSIKVVEEVGMELKDSSSTVMAKDSEVEAKSLDKPSNEVNSETRVENEIKSMPAEEFLNTSSVTLDGSYLQDESNTILIDGKYQCMFCESFYSKSRGLFNHCSSEHFHDEIKVKFGHLISSGRCTLCNKKVRVPGISQHLGSVHRKVNEMMQELGLPLIPCGDAKINQDTTVDEDKDDEISHESNKEESPRTTRSQTTKIEIEASEIKLTPSQVLEETGSESSTEGHLNLKHIKLPSRLKISQVEETNEDHEELKSIVMNGGGRKGGRGVKRVSFGDVEEEPRIKGDILKSPKISVGEQSKLLITTKAPEVGNLKEVQSDFSNLKNDKITPITLKFGKGKGSLTGKKEPVEIKQIKLASSTSIKLPTSTTIRFENNLESNKTSDKVDIKSVDVKKKEIKSSLKEIEARLKEFDEKKLRDTKKQKEIDMKQEDVSSKAKENQMDESVNKSAAAAGELHHTSEDRIIEKDSQFDLEKEKEAVPSATKSGQTNLRQNEETQHSNEMVKLEIKPEVCVEIQQPCVQSQEVGMENKVVSEGGKEELGIECKDVVLQSEEVLNNASPSENLETQRDDEIREELDNLTDTEVPRVDEKTIESGQQNIETEVKLVIDQKVTTNKEVLKSPIKSAMISDSQVNFFNCPLCIYIVDKKLTLREHLSNIHYKNILLEMFTEKDSKSRCKVCKKTYSNENHLSRHIGSNHKKLKEITSVHSKVYSVDNSKIPSTSDNFPCLACIKCKADSCMKCIACMEIKCNPKVTEAICFKKRCSSPISEAEFEVMKLIVDVEVKVEPTPVDVKTETVESVVVETESVVPVESEDFSNKCNPNTTIPGLKSLPIEKKSDEIDEIQLKFNSQEFLPKGFTINVRKHLINPFSETSENISEDVKEDNYEETSTENTKSSEASKVDEQTSIELSQTDHARGNIKSDNKRKNEETKNNKSKRSKSNNLKVTTKHLSGKNVNIKELSPSPKPASKNKTTDIPIAAVTTTVHTALMGITSPRIPPATSANTLSQLKTALGSQVNNDQESTSNDLKKDIKNLAKKSTDTELKNESIKSPARIVESNPDKSRNSSEILKCFKCAVIFVSRSELYQHYSVKHFYSHIIKTFKPQAICPIPSCNVAISKENVWVSHVGAKHNIVEGFIPKEHRINAASDVKDVKSSVKTNSESKENTKPKGSSACKSVKLPLRSVTSASKTKSPEVPSGSEMSSDGSYRWWQDLGGDLLKGFEKKGETSEQMNEKLVGSRLK